MPISKGVVKDSSPVDVAEAEVVPQQEAPQILTCLVDSEAEIGTAVTLEVVIRGAVYIFIVEQVN